MRITFSFYRKIFLIFMVGFNPLLLVLVMCSFWIRACFSSSVLCAWAFSVSIYSPAVLHSCCHPKSTASQTWLAHFRFCRLELRFPAREVQASGQGFNFFLRALLLLISLRWIWLFPPARSALVPISRSWSKGVA
jgi:hypothetical protein